MGFSSLQELRDAQREDMAILVPAPVLVEWLMGRPTTNLKRIFDLVDVVELDADLAKAAAIGLQGVARPACKQCGVRGGPSVTDATVMALANQEGDTVYTQDQHDLEVLNEYFPRVFVKSL